MKWLVEFEGVDLDGPMSRCGFRAIDYAGKVPRMFQTVRTWWCPMSFISLGHVQWRVLCNMGASCFLTTMV